MTILRALAQSLRLPDRLPQSSGRGLMSGGMGLITGAGQSGADSYTGIGAAFGPIRRLVEAVSLTDWSLYEQTEVKGKKDRAFLDDATAPARHPATALWTQLNPYMSRRFFLDIQQLWQETGGGCYWLLVNGGADADPFLRRGISPGFEVWPIAQDKITPVEDRDKYLAGYVYRQGIELIPLPVQAVVPVGTPDPHDPLKFAGPLQSILTDLESERYASQYQRNVFLNSAEPGGVLQFDMPLSQDRWEEIVMRWREQHQGLSNTRRVAVLEQGKWVERGQKNVDLEYEKLRRLSEDQVMFALGMPPAVMVSRDINLANASEGIKLFYGLTVRPRLERIKEAVNLRLLPLLGDNLTMDFELPVPQDPAFDVYAGTSGWLAGLLTQNQALEALGYGAIDEGDRYLWELTGTPPPITSPRPPRRPTNLSYQQKHRHIIDAHEPALTGAWQQRLDAVRDGYASLLERRNGH